jgi:TatD DNase family protein
LREREREREREEWRQRRGREEAPSIQKKRGLQKADETFRRSRRRRKEEGREGRVAEEAWKAMAMAITRTPLFDVHCHLQDNRIVDTAPSLIKAATKAGVKWMAVNGTSEADWEKVRQMSEHNSCIIPCFGLHPWWASQRSKDWLSKLRCMLQSVPCSTVGEIGLCQSIRGREVEESIQVDVLRQQLELARELERPAAIHCVRAFGSLQGLLEEMGSFPAGIILHSYSGPPEFVKVFAKHGAYFSFSGFNTHVKPQKARRVWQQVPRDRLLLETDCPDALPQVDDPTALFWVPGDPAATAAVPSSNSDCCHEEELHSKSAGNGRGGIGKGALNQPANLRAILSHVASLLEVTEEVLADAVFTNASTLFSFPGSKLVDFS